MKIVVSYMDSKQIGTERWKMVRLSFIFDSSKSIDYIMDQLSIKDFSILEFSKVEDED